MNQKQKEYIKEKIKPLYKWGEMPRRRYNGIVKDKAWGVLGDYVRIRDLIKFGTCVSCGRKVNSYHQFDPGHYFSMGAYSAELGFHHMNIHGQCKKCNAWGGMDTGADYEKELIKRYGEDLIPSLAKMKRTTIKADDWFYIKILEDTHKLFVELKEEHPKISLPEYVVI